MPVKKLGQNFLLSQKALNQIISLSSIQPADIVLEVGPGKGALTELLIQKAQRVIAIEKDPSLVAFLKGKFQEGNLTVISGDIRDYFQGGRCTLVPKGSQYKVVSNPPYYLSSFLLRQFLAIQNKPNLIALTLQREVAERICASPGKMSMIAVMVNFYGKAQLGPTIKKTAFYPRPKVDSRILIISAIQEPKGIDSILFLRLVKAGFSQKRKLLINNLSQEFKIPKNYLRDVFQQLKLSQNIRAQQLSLGEWAELYQKTAKNLAQTAQK